MLVVVVGRVVGDLLLDAGPGGVQVTAAEGHSVHQVLPLHVTPQSTEEQEKGISAQIVVFSSVQHVLLWLLPSECEIPTNIFVWL